MKKLVIAACLCMLNIVALAQSIADKPLEEIQYYMALGALSKGNYKEAISTAEEALKTMQAAEYNTDSLQAETHFVIGASQGGLLQTDKAVAEFNKAIEVYRRSHDEGSNLEAKMYGHSAHFLNSVDRMEEAQDYISKALAILLKNLPNNKTMAESLMLAAEISYKRKNYQDALDYQKYALNLFASLYGRHSDIYIQECGYMATYLKAAGKNEEAEEMTQKAQTLEKEAKEGYIPKPVEFKTAEQCRLYNEDALFAAKYYLNHVMPADSMAFVAQYIESFSIYSDEVHIFGGYAEIDWKKDGGRTVPWLRMAYNAGFIIRQLNEPEEMPSLDAYITANVALCMFYENNRQWLDKSKTIENYVKILKSDENKFIKLMEEQYNKSMADMESPIKMMRGIDSNVIQEHPIVDAIKGRVKRDE